MDSQGLKAELARQQLDFSYMQHVHVLTMQEQDAASRLAYAKLLAEKSAVDLGLQEIEASSLTVRGIVLSVCVGRSHRLPRP